MIEKLQGIVLGAVKHTDATSIVSVYTPERGRVPLLMGAARQRTARQRGALAMPLAQVEFSCRVNATRELQRPSGMTLTHAYRTLYFNPVKNAVGLFLAEFLGKLLREAPGEKLLFRYITDSLRVLDEMPGAAANFHLVFLSQLTTFMGIRPDTGLWSVEPHSGLVFDMRAGRYTRMLPGHPDILAGPEAAVPHLLDRLTYANMGRLALTRVQRSAILAGQIRYWAVHYPVLASLRSPAVLCDLFC